MIWATSILDFFSNPAFIGIVTFLLLILAIITCIFAYPVFSTWWRSKRHKKYITLRKISFMPLIDEKLNLFDGISISYNDEKIRSESSKNLSYFNGLITNEGEQDILKEYFQSEFCLNSEQIKWLEVKIKQSNNASHCQMQLSDNGSKLDVRFDILKPGDTIEIDALISIPSYHRERFFEDISITNGIKETVVEKKWDTQKKKDIDEIFDPILSLFGSLVGVVFCTAIFVGMANDYNKETKTDLGKKVAYSSSEGKMYNAHYLNNIVFLESIKIGDNNENNNMEKELVLFQKEFESKFKPQIVPEPFETKPSKNISLFVAAILYIVIGVFFFTYFVTTVIFVTSLIRILVSFLGKQFR